MAVVPVSPLYDPAGRLFGLELARTPGWDCLDKEILSRLALCEETVSGPSRSLVGGEETLLAGLTSQRNYRDFTRQEALELAAALVRRREPAA